MTIDSTNLDVAILMTVHNRKKLTLRCLATLYKSIESSNKCTFDIYLTDDGSTDGTAKTIKKKYPNINILEGSGNFYWTRGMNHSWREASKAKDYDFYLWLNDDVNLFKEAICLLIKSSKNKDHNAIVGGAFKSKTNGLATYGGISETGEAVKPNGSLQEINLLSGNFVLIPKKVYKEIGMLDECFHHGNGDFDYGLRAKNEGINIYLTPEYIGYCERHDDELPVCYNGDYSFTERFKYLYSPYGPNPLVNYKFYLRHYSICKTLKFLLKTNMLTLFPFLGKR